MSSLALHRTSTVVAGALAAVLAFFTLDLPVARWSFDDSSLHFLHGVLDEAETFGDGIGAALIIVTAWVLDAARRRRIVWLAGGTLAAGLSANLVKLSLARLRPRAWLKLADQSQHGPFDTFGTWWPLGHGGSGDQSFPSGHAATAFGLAVMLSAFYPRGRVWFYALAVLVAMQRVAVHAHFVSDVIVGGLLGWGVATAIVAWMAKAQAQGRPPDATPA
ncbi:MAG TPA: phosphatase PAP2 family protein [Pirellulales bacterium]|nr:phosphatase PAP2 family protein [Pirellulales bacterium]